MKCPKCHNELQEIGTADCGLNHGAWLKCQRCGAEFVSLDSDGTVAEYKPLPKPSMKLPPIHGPMGLDHEDDE